MRLITTLFALTVFAMVDYGHAFTHWAGQRPIGVYERLAYERHEHDLATGHERELWFDEEAADYYAGLFPKYLRFTEGDVAKKPFVLAPYQNFITRSIFGWMKLPAGMTAAQAQQIGADLPTARQRITARKEAGIHRRYQTAYVEVGKKGGKSPFAAGLALIYATMDKEYRAQCYTAAISRKQAKIVWEHAKMMVELNPADFKSVVQTSKQSIFVKSSNSFIMPMSREAGGEDGANAHFICVDELHRHKNGELLAILKGSFISRPQPMLFIITTAGDGKPGTPWFSEHRYCEQLLDGVFDNDAYFAFIAKADVGIPGVPDDDWSDERTWMKAQPGYGISARPEKIAEACNEAKNKPAALAGFKRFYLNIPQITQANWGVLEAWKKCADPTMTAESLKGRPCVVASDLSCTKDLTATVALFPPFNADPFWRVLSWAWIPQDTLEERLKEGQADFGVWVRNGSLLTTPGEVVDYRFVQDAIAECCEQYDVHEIAFDRNNATMLANQIQDSLEPTVIYVPQTFTGLSAGMKELERLILSGQIRHNGNEVATWCVSNTAPRTMPSGDMMPDKNKSVEKIDVVTAMVIAMSRAIRTTEETSPYNERGFLAV